MSSNSTVPTSEILDLTSTYGALYVSAMLKSLIYGASCIQLFLYYTRYEKDPKFLKTFVFFVWGFATADLILVVKGPWPVFVSHWGSLDVLSTIRPELVHHIWVTGVTAVAVQYFYLHRMYMFSGSKIVPIIIAIIALFQLFQSIPLQILLHENGFILTNSFKPEVVALNITNRSVSAVVDVLIAGSMIFYLTRKGQNFRGTRRMVSRLLVLTVSTGAWSALFALLDVIFLAATPNDLYWTMFDMPLGSVYLCSLLANLNGRQYVRGESYWNEPSTNIMASTGQVHSEHTRRSRLVSEGSRKDNIVMVNIERSEMSKIDEPSFKTEMV